jgi:hypothetical protein
VHHAFTTCEHKSTETVATEGCTIECVAQECAQSVVYAVCEWSGSTQTTTNGTQQYTRMDASDLLPLLVHLEPLDRN